MYGSGGWLQKQENSFWKAIHKAEERFSRETMKHRSTQFAARKNPDSPRVHGLRLSVRPSGRSEKPSQTLTEVQGSPLAASASEVPSPLFSVTTHEVTERRTRDEGQLLTVQEVAALLRVPVSWVYGRTRKRSLEGLPGYRLGKYWRFREEEILVWVQRQRGGYHAA
jgi:excisionase family DNA binding protein